MTITPAWVMTTLLIMALILMAISLLLLQRDWNDMHEAAQLQARWRRQWERAR